MKIETRYRPYKSAKQKVQDIVESSGETLQKTVIGPFH